MIEQLGLYLTSVILGTMVFFSFVVAPVTFTTLNEENARKFIRKIFPYYYLLLNGAVRETQTPWALPSPLSTTLYQE